MELVQTHVYKVNDTIQLSHPSSPLLLLLSVFPHIRVFSNESAVYIRWPKYWNFSFSITPSNEYSRLISFRIDWFDLLAFQETLKSLLQHHSSEATILRLSAFFKLLSFNSSATIFVQGYIDSALDNCEHLLTDPLPATLITLQPIYKLPEDLLKI